MISTSSFITIKDASGRYTGIYCNWDGYTESTGYILSMYYVNPQKLKDLIALGSISELGINPTTKYQDKETGFIDTTIGYNNPGSQFSTESYETLIEECKKNNVSYLYVFDEVEAEWFVAFIYYRDNELQSLTPDMVC